MGNVPQIREAAAEETAKPLMLDGETNDVRVVETTGAMDARKQEKPRWRLNWLMSFVTMSPITLAGPYADRTILVGVTK